MFIVLLPMVYTIYAFHFIICNRIKTVFAKRSYVKIIIERFTILILNVFRDVKTNIFYIEIYYRKKNTKHKNT